jgi:putative transposase
VDSRGRGLLAGVSPGLGTTAPCRGVRPVVSNRHAGLVAAIRRCLEGAAHQRCRVHFARNLLAVVPKGHQEMVAAAFRTIFAQVSAEEIAGQWDHVQAMLEPRFPKAARLMDSAKTEALAFAIFPRAHLAPAVVDEHARASQHGAETPLSGRGHLPERRGRHPPRRHGHRRESRLQFPPPGGTFAPVTTTPLAALGCTWALIPP